MLFKYRVFIIYCIYFLFDFIPVEKNLPVVSRAFLGFDEYN